MFGNIDALHQKRNSLPILKTSFLQRVMGDFMVSTSTSQMPLKAAG